MIIEGKALAQARKEEVIALRKECGALRLGVVVTATDAVTESYIRIKKRVAQELDVEVIICTSVEEANQYDGVILQLPLSQGMDVDVERNKILPEKDVDVLSDNAFRQFVKSESIAVPPVAAAMNYILLTHGVSVVKKQIVVIGEGKLVGKPAAVLFEKLGAEVEIVNRDNDLALATRSADIIVLGAGEPGIVTPDMIKEGVVVLDAGTSEAGGVIKGDADPTCAEKASLFTPVPGGIGPLAVVEIFANLVVLCGLSKS